VVGTAVVAEPTIVAQMGATERSRPRAAVLARTVAGLLAVLLVLAGGYWVRYPVLELLSFALRGDCAAAPDELSRLGGEQVFRRLPNGAWPVAAPKLWQPCEESGSDNTGGRSVAYASTLTEDEIRRHYEAVARDSGWRLPPDEPGGYALAHAKKWTRDRCLWLWILRETKEATGSYTVKIEFWSKYARSYCED
jgi:hypothetical protein